LSKLNKISFLVFTLLLAYNGRAQQLTHWTYFTHNYLQYNPAAAGTTPCMDLKMGFRRQWRGFQGAPQTAFANIHGKIPPKKFNFIGLGGSMENDKAGPFSYTSLQVMAAYHMRMAKRYNLSAGLGLGFMQYHVNYGEMFLEFQAEETAITNNYNKFVFPVFNTGVWLYRDDRFYGLSARNINSKDLNGLGTSKLSSHWTFTHGRAIKLSKELVFKPAALLNYVARSRASIEAQALLEFRQKLSLGMAGRSGHGFSAIMKIAAFKYVSLAYSYDITANKLRLGGQGAHEFILGIRACADKDKYDVPCAAYD
jgi:type IX secretion system PorP/SprF family membrane protein